MGSMGREGPRGDRRPISLSDEHSIVAGHWRAFGQTNEPKRAKSQVSIQNRANSGEGVRRIQLIMLYNFMF
jgi:hypothetical protein